MDYVLCSCIIREERFQGSLVRCQKVVRGTQANIEFITSDLIGANLRGGLAITSEILLRVMDGAWKRYRA